MIIQSTSSSSVADPGIPIGGVDPIGGHQPLVQALFGKNVCENGELGPIGVGTCALVYQAEHTPHKNYFG